MAFDTSAFDAVVRKRRETDRSEIRIVDYRSIGTMKDISAFTTKNLDSQEMADNFRVQMKGNAVILAGTHRVTGRLQNGFLHRFVSKQSRRSKPFHETASMVSLGNEQYTDAASNIWQVEGEGDDARIVMATTAETDDLLSAYKARIGTNSSMMAKPFAVRGGDFAAYVADNGLNYGVVHSVDRTMNKATFISMDNRRVEVASTEAIIAAFDPARQPGILRGARDISKYDVASKTTSLKELFDYLGQIWPADYVRALKAAVGK